MELLVDQCDACTHRLFLFLCFFFCGTRSALGWWRVLCPKGAMPAEGVSVSIGGSPVLFFFLYFCEAYGNLIALFRACSWDKGLFVDRRCD